MLQVRRGTAQAPMMADITRSWKFLERTPSVGTFIALAYLNGGLTLE